MKVKEYLQKQEAVSLKFIADKMWPKNKAALAYLSRKLSAEHNSRPWTQSDEDNARKILHDLGVELSSL